ncbi:cytochrome P450 94A1-like [Mangifera indica]|uniref:cytochrome P450 94A1-like n=1 Tax=Mangifera indica TaxID=29780 RepID=UPI001CFA695D|nr:cytochrome P450 94A1-like [Mangifera indica]
MELFTLQTILFFSFIFLSFHLYFTISNKRTINTGFKNYPIIGILPDFIKNRHRFLEWSTDTLISCPTNTAFLYRPPKIRGIITANPLNVEHILKTNFENYPKGDKFIFLLEDFLGRGIFNSDGELWKVQRKTASYEFNTKSLRNFVMENVRSEIMSRFVPILSKASKSEQVVDLQDILERFAFDNICKVAFNVDPGCLDGDGTGSSDFMRAFEDAATLSAARFRAVFSFIWKIEKLLNIGSERVLRNSIKIVHEFANDIIHKRMEARAKNKDEDLLSRFIGNDEHSPEFLRDIVISFILAGRDTTSSALSYFFWLLSSRPDVQQKILKELELIRVRNGKSFGDIYSFDELRDMHYLHAAISEAMRLYPPVPIDTKASNSDDILPDGTFIGKEWFISYHTYAMGRIESIWGKNCQEYLPERWLENEIYRPENMFKYPVFHAGPRMCLGKDMAYIQMKSIAASVIERFVIDVQKKDKSPEHVLSLTLRMKDGLHVRVRARCVDEIKRA